MIALEHFTKSRLMPRSHISFLLLIGFITCHVTAKKPHVLFIVMDDLGSHDLGLHGTGINTPTCDKLVEDGIYLENYYVLPSCSPTRSAIMCGKYPLHTGIHSWIRPFSTLGLPLEEETLAQIMKKAGYKTHAVGKWHIGHSKWEYTPTFRGFDSFYGFYLGGQDYFTHQSENKYDMRYDREPNCGDGCSKFMDERGNYSTHVFTREAIHRIQEHKKEDDDEDSPLFLYLAFQAVHAPDEVPPSYEEPYHDKEDWSEIRKTYAGMLTAADEGIGNVTKALQDAGMWEDTLVMFTTDNGGPTETCAVQGSSNYPLRGGKCSIWEGGTTGDGFLSGPYLREVVGSDGVGSSVNDLFHCVDWLPTIADFLGVETKPKLDGISQLGVIKGDKTDRRKEVFVGYAWGMVGPAIRVGEWKLIEGGSGDPRNPAERNKEGVSSAPKYALFNLTDDPTETNNLADELPSIVAELSLKLETYKETLVPTPPDDPSCPWEPTRSPEFGPSWVPWCKKLVVYE